MKDILREDDKGEDDTFEEDPVEEEEDGSDLFGNVAPSTNPSHTNTDTSTNTQNTPQTKLPMPAWHSPKATNHRGLITWDAVQYIGVVEINGAVTEALLDTGGHGTIIEA